MTTKLSGFAVFKGLTAGQLAQIEEHCQFVEAERGGVVFRTGEPAESLYLVASGGAEVRSQVQVYAATSEVPVDFAEEGEVFGWSSLFPPFAHRLTAYAREDSTLLKIDRAGLQACCEGDPRLGYVVMHNIAATIGTRYRRMREILGREIQAGLTRHDPLA